MVAYISILESFGCNGIRAKWQPRGVNLYWPDDSMDIFITTDDTRFDGLQGNEHVHRLSNIFGFGRFNKGIQESKDIIITQIENLKKCVLNWNSLDLWNVEGIELLKELLGVQTINITIHHTSSSSFSLEPSINCSSQHTWLAAAWEIQVFFSSEIWVNALYFICFSIPTSMTKTQSEMVTEVSAILVANTILRCY